jgi:hypothetical protein
VVVLGVRARRGGFRTPPSSTPSSRFVSIATLFAPSVARAAY